VTKPNLIAAIVLHAIESGQSPRQAVDALFGAGAYDAWIARTYPK
jgi:hypothetical protein